MTKKRTLLCDFANSFFSHYHFRDSDKGFKFINNIRNLADQFSINKIVFCAEGGKSKYRKDILPGYKGDREKRREKDTPEEKARYQKFRNEEFPDALELSKMMGIPIVQIPGVEADDTLAYIANHIDTDKYELCLLSTDYDLLQILRPGIAIAGYNKQMVIPLSGGQKIPAKTWFNTKNFIDQYEIEPWQYAHVLATAGDSADSIPSPKGLGEGSALKMVQKHGTVQGITDNLVTLKIPRLSSAVLEVLQSNPSLCYAHRNLLLTDLKHTPEVEQQLFGQAGIDYLNGILDSLSEPNVPDKEAFREYCYEYGKVGIVEKLDFWLQPFQK